MASIKIIDRFIEQLEEVAQLGREAERFTELVAKHEARTLKALLGRIAPIMPYIDGPVPTREEWVGPDEPTAKQDRRTFHYKEPGIVLVNNFESTVRDDDGKMRYAGYKVAFTRSGKLVQLDRLGSWDEDQSKAFWSSDAHELEVDADFAERHLTECVASITQAVERGIKRQREHRDVLRGRLAMLKALGRIIESEDEGGAIAPEE